MQEFKRDMAAMAEKAKGLVFTIEAMRELELAYERELAKIPPEIIAFEKKLNRVLATYDEPEETWE